MDLSKNEAKNILDYDLFEVLNLIKEINQSRKKTITYSKNIFLPITHICHNNCGYCTFKETLEDTDYLLLNNKEIFNSVQIAVDYNCTEALFTLGESADEETIILEKLTKYGFESMVDYLYNISDNILDKYDILPHTNMGIISKDDLYRLSQVNASMGLMLETTNKKLLKTIVHQNSPGKNPKKRINFIENAGKFNIPFTTGLLVGIGETQEDHINSLFKIRELQDEYGHIQEIIIQNFKPKIGIPMENYPEPSIVEMIKLTLLTHLMFPDVSIQIPPNLNQQLMSIFAIVGADDIGGISPITKDFVNPDLPWPEIEDLKREFAAIDYKLVERLPVYDKYITQDYLSEKVYNKAIKIKKRINNQ